MNLTPAVCPGIMGKLGGSEYHQIPVNITKYHQTKIPCSIRAYPHLSAVIRSKIEIPTSTLSISAQLADQRLSTFTQLCPDKTNYAHYSSLTAQKNFCSKTRFLPFPTPKLLCANCPPVRQCLCLRTYPTKVGMRLTGFAGGLRVCLPSMETTGLNSQTFRQHNYSRVVRFITGMVATAGVVLTTHVGRAGTFFNSIHDESGYAFSSNGEQKFAFTERTGKFLMWPSAYSSDEELMKNYVRHESQEFRSFEEGLCCTEVGGKWGFVHDNGKLEIAPQFEDVWPFHEGYAWVKKDGKWGSIGHNGKFEIQPRYEEGSVFRSGYARIKSGGKWGFVNKSGKEFVAPIYDDVSNFRDGFAAVKFHGRWGFIQSSNGKSVIVADYEDALPFRDRVAAVKKEGKWGYVDSSGKLTIQPQFEEALGFCDGLAAVKKDGKWGFINKSGAFSVQPQFEDAWSFRDGFAAVKSHGKWGYLTGEGKMSIEPKFDEAWNFQNNYAAVKVNGKWGYVGRYSKTKLAIAPQFEEAWPFNQGFAPVKKDGKWGYIRTDGKFRIPPVYDHAWRFEGLAPVKFQGKWGLLRDNGEMVYGW